MRLCPLCNLPVAHMRKTYNIICNNTKCIVNKLNYNDNHLAEIISSTNSFIVIACLIYNPTHYPNCIYNSTFHKSSTSITFEDTWHPSKFKKLYNKSLKLSIFK